jgi:hypothetical protein
VYRKMAVRSSGRDLFGSPAQAEGHLDGCGVGGDGMGLGYGGALYVHMDGGRSISQDPRYLEVVKKREKWELAEGAAPAVFMPRVRSSWKRRRCES